MTMEPEFATDTIADKDFEELLLPELKAVGAARPAVAALYDAVTKKNGGKEQPYAIGLALSGGGIRSATVSLGIMQKLAQAGILKEVDYLSTVSGGGYVGSALTWWLRDKRPPLPPYDTGANFPFGITDPKDAETPQGTRIPGDSDDRLDRPLTPLQYLRVQGNYLTPSDAISLWSGLAIVLRAVFLNLLVWIPLTAFAMLLLLWFGLSPLINGLPYLVNMSSTDLLSSVANVTGAAGSIETTAIIPPVFLLMLLIAAALLGLFVLGSLNHSILSWTNRTEARGLRWLGAIRLPNPALRWPKVGVIGIIGFVILGVMILWLMKVGGYLFANTPPEPAVYQPATGWRNGLAQFVVAALATLGLNFALGRAQWVSHKGFAQIWKVVLGFLGLVIADGIVNLIIAGGGPPWLANVSALLQFVLAVAFLAYAFYVVGLLIRHVLRDEAAAQLSEKFNVSNAFFLEYQSRRTFETFFGAALRWAAVLAAIGLVPVISTYIHYALGGVWAAAGFGLTLIGQWRGRVAGHGKLSNTLIMIGAALFAYGIVLLGYNVAALFIAGGSGTRGAIFAAILIAAISGWFVNTNHIGLHRYYRDRLMEAFMPDDRTLKRDVNQAAGEANQFQLAQAWSDAKLRRPYHIINTNLVLSNSKQRKYRLRGGDNFILSPLHIGSSATGWKPTAYSENADMTLASAMAISAAAANPRGGAGGKGLTTSPSVSIVMSLLNIRLGYWIRNPKFTQVPEGATYEPGKRPSEVDSKPAQRPNHFWPGGVYGLTRGGYREDCAWLEIADGGHFENLAVYELIRRRCGLIIVCDGARDNASSYNDLVTAVQRIGEDFGAAVRFDLGVKPGANAATPPARWPRSSPAQLIASEKLTDYPKGAEFAEKGYFVASIDYGRRGGNGWPRTGLIIYLKSTLITALDIRAKGYRGANKDFPQQSTGDQFFDEEQFEAYREVGFRIAEQMVADLDLATLLAKGRPKLDKLRSNDRVTILPA